MSAKTKGQSGTPFRSSIESSSSTDALPSKGGKLATVLSFLLPAVAVVGLLYLLAVMRVGAESAMAGLSTLLPVGYAFSAGMVASVNPCGFLLLPSYILYHLGNNDEEWSKPQKESTVPRLRMPLRPSHAIERRLVMTWICALRSTGN